MKEFGPVDLMIDLVALMWIGRGTFDAETFEVARSTARDEAVHSTSDYLLGSPLCRVPPRGVAGRRGGHRRFSVGSGC
ncbi:MAG: DUF3775 domain-containing protein [Alphaproteobacteria bacterium]|nr:DUF3775 domain-containing protein [Alphaproteobacteria bacterium]